MAPVLGARLAVPAVRFGGRSNRMVGEEGFEPPTHSV